MRLPHTCAILDDDSDWRDLVDRALLRAGLEFALAHFEDPWRALAELRQVPRDLVVTDFRMPAIDGCSFTRHVRTFNATVPVIIMSSDDVSSSEILGCGANWFVPKRNLNSELPYAVCTLLQIPFDPLRLVPTPVWRSSFAND